LPCSPRSTVLRVWLPSRRCKQPQSPWKPLSASDARGLSPSELRSSSVIEKKVSRLLIRSGSFRPGHPGLAPELQRLSSHRRSGAPSCFPGFLRQGGAHALLGVVTLRVFTSETSEEKCLSSPHPSRSFRRAALRPPGSGTPGV